MEKKKFENLHNSIQDMIDNKKAYIEFQKKLDVIKEKRKFKRKMIRSISHDEYLVTYFFHLLIIRLQKKLEENKQSLKRKYWRNRSIKEKYQILIEKKLEY